MMIQCLVQSLSEEIDRGPIGSGSGPEPHPLLLRQNRWRACRFGLDAALVDLATMEAQPARGAAEALVRRLEEVSGRLGCHRPLGHALEMTVRPTGA